MNKLVLLLILCSIGWTIYAKPVDPTTALQVAENFINAPQIDSTGQIRKVKSPKKMVKMERKVSSDQQFYIYQGQDGKGFVIVAADDVARPILGYSETGNIDLDNMPSNMRSWLEMYNQEIKWAQENGITADEETAEEWNNLFSSARTTVTTSVGPLLKTKWGQSPYYNQLCPWDNKSGKRTVTGCPATAMAQVMKYWEWPKQGRGMYSYDTQSYGTLFANFGATTYDWDNMPSMLFSSSSTGTLINQSTSSQKETVATLMYHCGVSIETNYGIVYNDGTGGSGIAPDSLHRIPKALMTYFLYDSKAHLIKQEDFLETTWTNTFKKELDEGRPIIHVGFGSGGHCFVCDGYNSDNQFHFNWGWSGDHNGWFLLNALYKRGFPQIWKYIFNYTNNQRAVIGIHPIDSEEFPAHKIQLSSNWVLSSDSIQYTSSFSGQIKIKNVGTEAFEGKIVAIVLDKNYNYFTEYTLNSSLRLQPNAEKSFSQTISTAAGLIPGTYYVSLYYAQNNGGLQLINGTSQYTNLCRFKVYHKADLETASEMTIVSDFDNTLTQGKSATISVGVRNKGTSAFFGDLFLVFLDPENLSVGQDFDAITLKLAGIGVNKYYNCVFDGVVTLEPGTYIAVLGYKPQNGTSNLAGSTNFSNPIYINVLAEPILPDKYEENDSISTASFIYPTFESSKADITIDSLSIHNGADVDYFIIPLDKAKDYTCTIDTGNWKSNYPANVNVVRVINDTTMDLVRLNESFDISDADNLLIEVHPSFEGNTGYYKLFIKLEEKEKEVTDYKVIVAQRNIKSNWFYLTAEKDGTKDRMKAVDSGTSSNTNIPTTGLEDKYYWNLEEAGDSVYLKSKTKQYISWTSGNTALLSAKGLLLNAEVGAKPEYTRLSLTDVANSTTRYLALNATDGNNYFAFYGSQIMELLIIPKGGSVPTKLYKSAADNLNVTKVIRNGQLLIQRNGKTYNAQGAEIK